MAVRKVLGQADSTRSGFCPSSGSEQLFKENLAAFPPPFIPLVLPRLSVRGPLNTSSSLESWFLKLPFFSLNCPLLLPVLTAGSGAFGSGLTHLCYLSSWMKVNKSQCFTLCSVTLFPFFVFFFQVFMYRNGDEQNGTLNLVCQNITCTNISLANNVSLHQN